MNAPDLALRELPMDSTWRRLSHTPLRDLLHGRLTARLDIAREIAAVGLPAEVAALVYTVAQRTRLWRREKLDVASELSSHFRDGLESGAPPEQLIERFGNLRQAASLIRRASKRNRPQWWHICRGVALCLGGLFLLLLAWFLWSAARFWLSRPTIARDFVAEINAPAQTIPRLDRAWPFYRDAGLALQTTRENDDLGEALSYRCEPGDPTWQRMLAHLQQNQQAMQLTRQGAERPRFGFVFGDPADAPFMQARAQRDSVLPKPDESLIQILLPHIQEMRGLARLLDMDARRAAADKDAAALQANLRAMLGLANHVWDSDSFLIGDLVSLACFQITLERIGRSLAENPELFGESDLRDLSHGLSAYADGGDIRPRMAGERMMMLDILQRIYSDDGAGDGHVTAEGHRFLYNLLPLTNKSGDGNPPWYHQHLIGPAAVNLIAGRAEMTELAMRLYDRLEVEQRGPLHQRKPSEVDEEIQRLAASTTLRIRYLPVLLMFPAAQQVSHASELAAQRRDGLLAALALELHHRRTGNWPAALTELTPGIVPTVPLDRFTGEPLGYRVVDGRPLLYSRGSDRIDDGGTPPPGEDREQANQRSGVLGYPLTAPPQKPGYDFLLWPPAPLREPPKDGK